MKSLKPPQEPRAPQNDGYSLSTVGARERERGRLEERIKADAEIEALKKSHVEELESERASRQLRLEAARGLGAVDATDKLKFEFRTVIARTSLPPSQRRMLSDLVDALPAPAVPDVVGKLTAEIAALHKQRAILESNIETQISMKQEALAGRAKALADVGRDRAATLEDGRVAGLLEASKMIRGASIQKSAKGPTKTSVALAEQIMDLAKS